MRSSRPCWRAVGVATLLGAAMELTACAGNSGSPAMADPPPTPPPPTPPEACSPWPRSLAPLGTCPPPATDQAAACSGNARPRIEQVSAVRAQRGVSVTFFTVDADSQSISTEAYLNHLGGGACGGLGPGGAFTNNLTFPVSVRLVAWDERGCLASPVCLTVQ